MAPRNPKKKPKKAADPNSEKIVEIEIQEFPEPLVYTAEETGLPEDIPALFRTAFFGLNRRLLDVAVTDIFRGLPFAHYEQLLRSEQTLKVRTNSRAVSLWFAERGKNTLPLDLNKTVSNRAELESKK